MQTINRQTAFTKKKEKEASNWKAKAYGFIYLFMKMK
jgi:hypothetical protein